MNNLDLSFARAAIVLPKEYSRVNLVLVGAGGTGSYAAPALARLAFELIERSKEVSLTIIDPDAVEANNIPRSNFCRAEIGKFKAQTLAERLALAWGMKIGYANEKLVYEKHLKDDTGSSYRQITVLVGCVDNHEARIEINRCLSQAERYVSSDAPNTWWIDGGNGKSSGQVLIGSTNKMFEPKQAFGSASLCRMLPSPAVQHPELLTNQEIALKRTENKRVSCPELVRLGEQSLNINNRVAVEINQMLTELLLSNNLKRFATYFDLESGTAHSKYCTPEAVAQTLTHFENQAADSSQSKSKRRISKVQNR